MSRRILIDDDAAQYANLQERLKRLESSMGELQRRNPDGTGSPEGVVDGPKGALYRRGDGTSGTLVYLKTTAEGTLTGWSAIH
jgi:hypothetical protein